MLGCYVDSGNQCSQAHTHTLLAALVIVHVDVIQLMKRSAKDELGACCSNQEGSLSNTMAGAFLSSLPCHLDLDISLALPLPLESPRISHCSTVVDFDVLQASFVKIHSEAADQSLRWLGKVLHMLC